MFIHTRTESSRIWSGLKNWPVRKCGAICVGKYWFRVYRDTQHRPLENIKLTLLLNQIFWSQLGFAYFVNAVFCWYCLNWSKNNIYNIITYNIYPIIIYNSIVLIYIYSIYIMLPCPPSLYSLNPCYFTFHCINFNTSDWPSIHFRWINHSERDKEREKERERAEPQNGGTGETNIIFFLFLVLFRSKRKKSRK